MVFSNPSPAFKTVSFVQGLGWLLFRELPADINANVSLGVKHLKEQLIMLWESGAVIVQNHIIKIMWVMAVVWVVHLWRGHREGVQV
jgi:hypothetical protein